MKAVVLRTFGDPEVLEVEELPEPHAAIGEVRIRVHAATVNPADTLMRVGDFGPRLTRLPPPYIPGMEAAGVVDEIGPGSDISLSEGMSVMAVVTPIRPGGGAYAEQIVVPASWAVRIPADTSFAQAASLPMNGLAALHAIDLLDRPGVHTVAVTGAAGSLGAYAVSLAADRGFHVIADAAPTDEMLVKSFGAHVVVRRGPDVAQEIRGAMTEGVDALVDAAVQGERVMGAVRDGGLVVSVRRSDERGSGKVTTSRGIGRLQASVGEYIGRRDKLELLRDYAERGVLLLRVACSFPPEQAGDAHRLLERGGTRGRIVIEF